MQGVYGTNKKAPNSLRVGGLGKSDPDEIRTRDLLRDRQAF